MAAVVRIRLSSGFRKSATVMLAIQSGRHTNCRSGTLTADSGGQRKTFAAGLADPFERMDGAVPLGHLE